MLGPGGPEDGGVGGQNVFELMCFFYLVIDQKSEIFFIK